MSARLAGEATNPRNGAAQAGSIRKWARQPGAAIAFSADASSSGSARLNRPGSTCSEGSGAQPLYCQGRKAFRSGWPAFDAALSRADVPHEGHILQGRQPRLPQRHDPPLRRSGGERGVAKDARLAQHISAGLKVCSCAMGGFTARARARIRARVRPHCMSMRRPTPACLRSIMASPAYSTSPIPMTRYPPTRRAPPLAGAPTSEWSQPEPRH